MRCPVCAEPLIVLEIDQVEIDHCIACGGVWLDAGELELLLDGATNRDTVLDALTRQTGGTDKEIRCPICSKTLTKVLYNNRVLLDMCLRNHGLWFDRGELREVMEMGDFPANHRIYELIRETFSDNTG